jgi:ribulose-5-phosphate 4-epimerase/fuculose-1-phosphate aldolase
VEEGASTRCFKTFPSIKHNGFIYVSARDTDKSRITVHDMVIVKLYGRQVLFSKQRPSVDTPVQLKLYETFDSLNYIIHGHAYIEDAPFTKSYFPCGDLREFDKGRI